MQASSSCAPPGSAVVRDACSAPPVSSSVRSAVMPLRSRTPILRRAARAPPLRRTPALAVAELRCRFRPKQLLRFAQGPCRCKEDRKEVSAQARACSLMASKPNPEPARPSAVSWPKSAMYCDRGCIGVAIDEVNGVPCSACERSCENRTRASAAGHSSGCSSAAHRGRLVALVNARVIGVETADRLVEWRRNPLRASCVRCKALFSNGTASRGGGLQRTHPSHAVWRCPAALAPEGQRKRR